MSSGRNDIQENGNEKKLSNLRAILGDGIPKARLIQVLEASNGSLEHAIEIYFHQMQQPSNASGGNPEVNSSITSVEDESTETAVNRSDRGPNNERDSEITVQNDKSTDAIVGKKRSQRKISSPENKEKRVVTKQARLDSFFRVNPNNGLHSPSSTQKTEGLGRKLNKTPKGMNPSKTKASKTSGGFGSSPLNTSALKTVSKPAVDNVEIKNGDIKSNHHTNADSISLVSFQRLCETLQEMTDTTKRLVKLSALETFIREIIESKTTTNVDSAPEERCDVSMRASVLSSALELVLGGITSTPLNVSGSAVSKALQTGLGISRNQISKAYRKYGDIGDCAASFFQKKTHFIIAPNRRQLSICQVAEGLQKISEIDGRDAKQHILLNLLRRCQSKMECRFLVRLLIRNMRIGANIKTILASLAMAMVPLSGNDEKCEDLSQNNERKSIDKSSSPSEIHKQNTKDAIALVQKTYDVCPSISRIVRALLEGGFDQMKRECSLSVMTPIAPMLAHPVHSLDEIKEKMEECGDDATMEWKYDGMRCQAHYDGSNIKLFSRHMLNMTDQFPDVVDYLKEAVNRNVACDSISFVIDAEIVGVEGEGIESRLLPFQDLSTRRKKADDGNGIRVRVFAFDLMFLNGESLVNEQLFKRISMLHELFVETNDFSFVSSQTIISYDESKIKSFLSEAVESGAEGLMVKLLGRNSVLDANQKVASSEKAHEGMDSLYEAGTRSHSWLKVKRDYVAGFSDTIDVVPIGAWWGSGRKAQKSFLSPILLAVYDDEEDVYRSICRCMTFTDVMYESIREFYFNGIAYPSHVDSQAAENSGDKTLQKLPIEDEAIIDDDNSCDDHEDDDNKEEESQRISPNEEYDGQTRETDRVNCFPGRPSSAFVITNESPQFWFKPMEVFEVAFADLSLSRQHTAAAGLVDEEGRGIALRFPRFKRRRPDKKPEEATTSIEIAQLFAKQSKIKNRPRPSQQNRSK